MKRRQLIQRAAALGGAAAAAPLIAACGPAATAPSASPAASAAATATAKPIRTLKVGYIPLTDFLGMYAAIEQGYIADEGLKLELQAMSGGAAIIPAITVRLTPRLTATGLTLPALGQLFSTFGKGPLAAFHPFAA